MKGVKGMKEMGGEINVGLGIGWPVTHWMPEPDYP